MSTMTVGRLLLSRRTITLVTLSTLGLAGSGYYYLNSGPDPVYHASTRETKGRPPPAWTPPAREAMLDTLWRSGQGRKENEREEDNDVFDLLIVGGGATGAGVAVDAASRGLKVALVERSDFGSGTSSKSTKLVHGGVRYLQKAVMELDYEQYKLVREALRERRIFLQTAPYLSHMLPIMLPLYKYWQVPYYYVGCKMYDLLAGKENVASSYLMSRRKALETFPMLKSEGLVGAVVYYDGQHNDARMNVALIMTAVKLGATVANYCGVTALHKNAQGKLVGARVKDELTGREFDVRAKGVINATGPYADALLSLDDPSHKPIVRPSSGVHITLPAYYAPARMGLLDPATSDGRVIFFLPWEGGIVAGTTDTPAKVNTQDEEVTPAEEDVRWVMDEIRGYLSPDIQVRRSDVLSAWSGLRPLISNGGEGETEGLVRNHVVRVAPSGLITIAGGKWTTYRAMAEEAVDKAVELLGPKVKVKGGCQTAELKLVGSEGWSPNMFIGLVQRCGLDADVAKRLSESYGDCAWTVCELAESTGQQWPGRVRLSPNHPYMEAEVLYATRHEYACTAIDVLARRTRLAFVDVQAAVAALPRVVEIMSKELGWSRARQKKEYARSVRFLGSMGLDSSSTANTSEESWSTWSKGGLWRLVGMIGVSAPPVAVHPTTSSFRSSYGCATFEAGEVEALGELFGRHASVSSPPRRINKSAIRSALNGFAREWPGAGYEELRESDFRYVFAQKGLERRTEVDMDEFVEICSDLKEVSMTSAAKAEVARKQQKRNPRTEQRGFGA